MAKKNTSYQIKITLRHIRPPIWRLLLVPADCTMDALHCALQTAMGWTDAHLYAFRTKDRDIEIPDPDNMWDASWSRRPKPEDAGKVKLSELAEPGDTIIYDYDFGDGWEHTVVIEKAVEADDVAARKAVCLEGERACPPEDCGGPWRYQHLLAVLAKPEGERSENEKELADWVGGEWDAEAFSLDGVNRALAGWKPDQVSFMYAGICG